MFGSGYTGKYIYLTKDDRDSALARYRVLLRKLSGLAGQRSLAGKAFGIWLTAMLVLFVLLAYRPALVGNGDGRVGTVSAGQAFREYLGRVAGTVPPECAVIEEKEEGSAEGRVSNSQLPWTLALWGEAESLRGADGCAWRSRWWSLVAAFSPNVGLVQKVTLLFLIVGLLVVRRSRLQARADAAAFPGADPRMQPGSAQRLYERYVGQRLDPAAAEDSQEELARGEHPVTVIDRQDGFVGVRLRPLYPVTFIGLDREHDSGSEVLAYGSRVREIKQSMARYGEAAPADLILDVLNRGIATGSVGEADERTRVAVFDYRDRLVGRLWAAEYIVWFLPTIGFLGTIYGISTSLVRAKGLFAGGSADASHFETNIRLVVDGLGVAFDTTSMALICATALYLSLRSVQAQIAELAEGAQETLSRLLVGRMVDRAAIPKAESFDG